MVKSKYGALPKIYFTFCRRRLEAPYSKLTNSLPSRNHTGENIAEALKETLQSWDCVTRWAKMVRRLLEQEKAVHKVVGDDSKTSHLIPTWQDIDALGPLGDFTDMLSAENYVTLSALNPVLHILKSEVLVDKDEDTAHQRHEESYSELP